MWVPRRHIRDVSGAPSGIKRELYACMYILEEIDSPAVSALGVRSRKLSNALNGQSWDG
jgi:hypothetical protein